MNTQYKRPKTFGGILDHTFRLCKNNFSKFFLILLIITGPIYLLEAIILLSTGTSFFRSLGAGDTWFDQIIAEVDANNAIEPINWGQEIGNLFIGLLLLIVGPVAQAAIFIGVFKEMKQEGHSAGDLIKKAFSKFWPIIGSSLIFGAILFGIGIVAFIVILIASLIGGIAIPIIGFLFAIPLFLGLGLGILFLFTRWSLYLCAVIFEDDFPGLGRSWRLTRENTWRLIGLYLILFLITLVISLAVELVVSLILGYSVLYTIIVNLVSFITTMIFAVAYAVIYFDLRARKEADDLNEMIEEYDGETT